MNYRINDLVLDPNDRTLVCGDKIKKIRPRTLKLLLYFISNQHAIKSKEELLSAVWPDVTVDEGVVFQSISEIRKLLEDSKVIVSHPRQGYQFVAHVEPTREKSTRKLNWKIVTASCIALIVLAVVGVIYFLSSSDSRHALPTDTRILILPVQNEIEYEDRKWLSIGGMDHIISTLESGTASLQVFSTEETISLINSAGFSIEQKSLNIQRILNLSGATHAVEVTFFGKNMEYTISITVNSPNNVHKKVILAESLDQGLVKAANEVLQQINGSVADNHIHLKNEFKHALFAEAMLAYERDWSSAVSFFESYLKIEPDSVVAMMYLMRLYIWLGDYADALQLYDKLNALPNLKLEEKSKLLYYRGMVALAKHQYQAALEFLNSAAELISEYPPSLLGARINAESGEVLTKIKDYQSALDNLNKSLRFYEVTGKVIDICAIKLKMSKVHKLSGNLELAQNLFLEAKRDITKFNISFLYAELEQAESMFKTPKN
ncbi:winged helix-turn-helix domain-containing protein [Catenovulum sediminis]|uniref:Winged helix-turn-helix domain-containing protein n=1 Tax=Catenovulum sediminis TaxID=1740262 RepID=A0ABV1RJG9_9ALTE